MNVEKRRALLKARAMELEGGRPRAELKNRFFFTTEDYKKSLTLIRISDPIATCARHWFKTFNQAVEST